MVQVHDENFVRIHSSLDRIRKKMFGPRVCKKKKKLYARTRVFAPAAFIIFLLEKRCFLIFFFSETEIDNNN